MLYQIKRERCFRFPLLMLLLCILAMMVSGCSMEDENDDLSNDTIVDEEMDYVEMSDKEVELLCGNFPDEDRIREGKLFSHQLEALRQLRAGMDYLAEKYPGYSLEVRSFEPATVFTKWAHIWFREEGAEEYYELTVTPSEDGYVCADTYYGVLIRDIYDRWVENILSENGFITKSYTKFSVPIGLEVNGDTDVDTVINMGAKINPITHLFLEEIQDTEGTAEAMQRILEEAGLYGSYTLYFVPELRNDVQVLESNRKEWNRVNFNCFNITLNP